MPRRETQIFSLSMMDVISGAMGAFLIIMIVLMRYYKEDQEVTAQREQLEQRLKEIREQIQEARRELMMTTDLDVEELLRRLMALEEAVERAQAEVRRLSNDLQAARNRVNQLQAQNDQLQSENRQLQARNSQLEQEKQKLESQLYFRRPFAVVAEWNAPIPVNVDLVLEDNLLRTDEGQPVYFHPDEPPRFGQPGQRQNDARGTSASEVWVERDSVPGEIYKVYVVLRPDLSFAPTKAYVYTIGGDRMFHDFGSLSIDGSRRWELVGFLVTDNTGTTTARTATEEERRRDRAEVEARMRQKKAEGQ